MKVDIVEEIKNLNIGDYKCSMPRECYEYSERELGETKDSREKYVNEIIQWYLDNPEINPHPSLIEILFFLRGAKFNVDKAKKKIQKYYRMRAERIEWFANRDPFAPELVELFDIGVFLPLLKRDSENRLVVVIRTAAHDPKIHKQNDVFKVGKMILNYAMSLDESISVYGIYAIFDMKDVQLAHALQLPPPLIKRAVESWEAYPCRISKLEFVNAPIYLNVILNVFKTFMSSKLKERIAITKGISQCPVQLPSDLGGNGNSYDELSIHWKQELQANAKWFKEDDQYKSIL